MVRKLTIPKGKKYLIDTIAEDGKPFFKAGDGLPSGIIDKKYTGIGATTLELKANRHSILVFPFKKLAEEKTEKSSSYFLFPEKAEKQRDVLKYIDAKEVEFKKICLVADRLGKLYNILEERPDFKAHLVLDEVEILQMQSNFRNRLPMVFDAFKEFENRTLVTATPLSFTDPDLKELLSYQVDKEEEVKESLLIVEAKNPLQHVVKYASKKLDEGYSGKFLIAVNSSVAIKQIINGFKSRNKGNKVKVIASKSTLDGLEKRYQAVLEGEQLPGVITICTAAYYSGFDIRDHFEAIAVNLDTESHHSLSFENHIQFFGRGRDASIARRITILKSDNDLCKLRESAENILSKPLFEECKNFVKLMESQFREHEEDKSDLVLGIVESKFNLRYSIYYQNLKNELAINYLRPDLINYQVRMLKDFENGMLGLKVRLCERYTCKKEVDDTDYPDLDSISGGMKVYAESIAQYADNPDEIYFRYVNGNSKVNNRALEGLFLFERTFTSDIKLLGSKLEGHAEKISKSNLSGEGYAMANAIALDCILNGKSDKVLAKLRQREKGKEKRLEANDIVDVAKSELSLNYEQAFDGVKGKQMALTIMKTLFEIEVINSGGKKYEIKSEQSQFHRDQNKFDEFIKKKQLLFGASEEFQVELGGKSQYPSDVFLREFLNH